MYITVVIIQFVYGINFFYLTYLAVRKKPARVPAQEKDFLPRVTVQLPFFNEFYVAERLVKTVSRLDWPPELLEIQVLDDSTDETAEILRRLVEQLRKQGVDIVYLHRQQRTGYKAGALAEGTAVAKGEFMAIFDADFVPPADFLRRAIPSFCDSRVAFVQARWGHLNPGYSLLTRLQSLSIDAHFVVEQTARSQGNYWFNFNGTAGVWRKQAVLDAGGWKWDTLTEDLDLSYRAFLHGWKAVYLPDLEVPAELPVSINAYRRQQNRWARGSLECAVRLIPQVWRSSLSLPKKVEATLHLTGYGIHLLLFTLTILYPVVLLMSEHSPLIVKMFGISALFSLTGLAPTIFFVAAQRRLGRNWLKLLPTILFLTALGSGMMVNTARAVYQVLRGKAAVFERTPKYGIIQDSQDWKHQKRYHLGIESVVLAELALALWNIGTLALSISVGDWGIGLYATVFSVGLLFVAGMSISQSITANRVLSTAAVSAGSSHSQRGRA